MNCRTLASVLVLLFVVEAAAAEVVRWIPAAGSNPGNSGTHWSTDLWITSLTVDRPIDVHLAFLSGSLEGAEPDEVTVEVPPHTTILLKDVVNSVLDESRPGAIRLRSDFPFEAQSRTFNTAGGNGTFGQAIPAIAASQTELGPRRWMLIGAANRPGEDGVRSNIGLYNMTEWETEVRLTVTSQETGQESDTTVSVAGYGWFQANVFELVGAADEEVENATVMVFGPNPRVSGYLSRIDNRSGDGAFFLPIDADYVYSTPGEWQVTLTLHVSVNVDALVYTGPQGWDVVVDEPEGGWSTTFTIESPAEFCFEVWAPNGGHASVVLELDRSNGGVGGGGIYYIPCSGSDESPSAKRCFHLG